MPVRKIVSLVGIIAVGAALTIASPGPPAYGDPILPLPSPSGPLPTVDPDRAAPALPGAPGSGAADPAPPGGSADPTTPADGDPTASPSGGKRGGSRAHARPRPSDPADPAGDLYPHPPFAPTDGNPSAALLQALYDAQAEQRGLRNQIDAMQTDLARVDAAVSEAKALLADAREAREVAADNVRNSVRTMYKSGAPLGLYTALEAPAEPGVIRSGARARLAALTTATDRLDLLSDRLAGAVDERDALLAGLADLQRTLKRADTVVNRYLRAAAVDLAGVPNPGLPAGFSGAPLQWPVTGEVTSEYGNRYDPYYRRWQLHAGIDIAAATGTPIRAAAGGEVVRAGRFGGYGNYICIAHGRVHGQRLTTCYGHLSRILVIEGQPLGIGQVVGESGSTGASTGPHLHFEVRVGGRPTNPRLWL